jgi:hypothetical protein
VVKKILVLGNDIPDKKAASVKVVFDQGHPGSRLKTAVRPFSRADPDAQIVLAL